jgi:hypothetical protein
MSTLAKQASYDDPIAPKMVVVTDTMKRADEKRTKDT